jgi:ribosome biogenesis GTPase A
MAAKVANKTDLVLGSVLKTWKRTFVGRNKKLVAPLPKRPIASSPFN